MITITRRQALQLRAVFRRALNMTRGPGPALFLKTGRDGIRVRASTADAAVEYHATGEGLPAEEMCVPFELLSDVEARRDDPVQIEMLGDGRVLAGWRDSNVPQMVQYDPVESKETAEFPATPETLAQNPPRFLQALHDCMQTTDPHAGRYATSCVQLRGKGGDMVATDGREVLFQRGFEFPWEDEALLPRSRVFGSKELPHDEAVFIGKTDDWLTIRVGPWTFHAKIEKKKRFPDMDHHLPPVESAAASVRFSPEDARFLTKTLPKLPGDEDYNLPVTMDLNGAVAIRAKASGQPNPTEAVLSNSTRSGEPMRIHTNRNYLSRAVKLGFDEVHLYSPSVPVLCQDEFRSYVWALLEPESAISPTDDAIRITSTPAEDRVSTTNQAPRRKKATMAQSTSNGNGKAKTNGQARAATTDKPDDQGVVALIEQAEAVKVSLRDSLTKTSELISALKLHKKQSKAVRSALVSLRRLQAVDA